jgi:hypothetical protein
MNIIFSRRAAENAARQSRNQNAQKSKKWKHFSLAEPAGFAEKTRERISSKTMRVHFGAFLSL